MTRPVLPLAAAAPAARPGPRGWPLLRPGFRPLHLGAAPFAGLSIPRWLALFPGQATPGLSVPALPWHAHETLSGFATAVIVGFLLTAGTAWTGLATPRDALLGALAALWRAARGAAIVGPHAL